jgi:predicted dehydrogenase
MINFGFSGCGGFIERAVLPLLQTVKQANVIAAFDVDQKRLGEICRKFSIQQSCAVFDELLRIKDIDVIYIASPNALHREQVIAAAEAGKHVFCQKPLGITVADCHDMIEACDRNRVKLNVGFCYRFGGAQQKVRELLNAGKIGKLSLFQFSFNLGFDPNNTGWRCDPKLSGGGPLMDLAPHMVDMANFFTENRPETVMAYVEPKKTETQVEMDVAAVLQYPKGVRAFLDIGFTGRAKMHNYLLIGDKGALYAEGTMPWRTNNRKTGFLKYEDNLKPAVEIDFSTHEYIAAEIKAFCDAVQKNENPPVPGQAGLDAQAVIQAIYESGETGMRVRVKY